MSTPENQSYLASSITKFSPWAGRSPASKPVAAKDGDVKPMSLNLKQQQKGADHRLSHRRGPSLRNYPPDCPPLTVQWFFAIDIPKRRPNPAGGPVKDTAKTLGVPKKYAAFSPNDSRAIETAFLKLVGNEKVDPNAALDESGDIGQIRSLHEAHAQKDSSGRDNHPTAKVPVNEDYLFDVDIDKRELAPAYWLGPVYDVRRATWFHQEGNVQRPCDENLATQLEEGYLKTTPWKFLKTQQRHGRSASQPRAALPSRLDVPDTSQTPASSPTSPKRASSVLRGASGTKAADDSDVSTLKPPETTPTNTHRLFGPYSNSVVTYQDATTAWVLTDDFISRMSSSMYQRFAGGSHLAGMKVTRGYLDPAHKPNKKEDSLDSPTSEKASQAKADNTAAKDEEMDGNELEKVTSPTSELRRRDIEQHMASLVSSGANEDPEKQAEEVRRRDEKEIRDDYKDQDGDEQNREIEHLLLVTHGIGQRLGLRMETVNFVHDVNTFRKTLKAVYGESPDLQALNSEVGKLPKNCRVQVLPINWRHKLDFPKQSLRHNRKEHDLADFDGPEEEDYPNLENITVEGVPAVRNLITDLALDILLYQSPAYKDHISRIVVEECNRIYKLFIERNPSFNGKVSLVGHSLGSAIMFDILCSQQWNNPKRSGSLKGHNKTELSLKLDFAVEDFYALGSPIGLFQMLQGRTIAARHVPALSATERGPTDALSDNVGVLGSSTPTGSTSMGTPNSELPVSSPKCAQIFNIFHPTDPISYRVEPLISPAMSSLKPQPLPYTKRGIFAAQMGQGLTGIGNRVGQSVSGLWSSFSSGIASSLLNRSLGISAEDEATLRNQSAASTQSRGPLSVGATVGKTAADVAGAGAALVGNGQKTIEQMKQDLQPKVLEEGEAGEHPPTLIESDLHTLYAGFEKRRKSEASNASGDLGDNVDLHEIEARARKLKKEEAKVRALNVNGRVDYSIQEGAFDISLIAAVASHLSYWADEDVGHFVISQLLSRQRIVKKSSSSGSLRG